MTIEELPIAFQRQALLDIERRANIAMEMLLQALQEAYYAVMSPGQRGAGGSVGALQQQVQVAEAFIIGIIGFGNSGDSLKFVEYGVQPGSPDGYPAYSSLPNVQKIYEWIRRGRIDVPARFKPLRLRAHDSKARLKALSRRFESNPKVTTRISRAVKHINTYVAHKAATRHVSDKPVKDLQQIAQMRFAWAIAIKRRKFGYRGLHVVAGVIAAQEQNLRAILEGSKD